MEQRMQDLEVKVAFLERHLGELDDVVRGLVDDLTRLRRELGELRDLALPEEKRTLEGDKPPHYGG